MSQLSRSDIRELAVCLQENATSHYSDHHTIRCRVNSLPAHLKNSKVANMLADTRGVARPCHLHDGIASLVISNLFADLQKEVDNSKILLDKYGPYLGPEETYTLERVKVIEGMWSPPTTRNGPFKIRYWDYQVNKCRACMISRVASDFSALRDIRTVILANINSNPNSSDLRLVPGQPTILTFVNEWISLTERADEIFYYSGNSSASIKTAKNMVDEGTKVASATSRQSGSKNFSYPHPSRTGDDPQSVSSSYQSIGIFTPTHTPGASTSSDYSNGFEWPAPTRHATSGFSSQCTTQTSTDGCQPDIASSWQQRSSQYLFIPLPHPGQKVSIDYSSVPRSPQCSKHSFSPSGSTAISKKEYDIPPTHRRGFSHDAPESSNGHGPFKPTGLAQPVTPVTPGHDSDTSFILRDPPPFSPPPPIPPRSRRRMLDEAAFGNSVPASLSQWEDSGAKFLQARSRMVPTPQERASWTIVDDGQQQEEEEEEEGKEGEELATLFHTNADTNTSESIHGVIPNNVNDGEENETPLISRWSEASSVNMWSGLLQKATTAARGPRLGKVKSGKPVLTLDTGKTGKEKKGK